MRPVLTCVIAALTIFSGCDRPSGDRTSQQVQQEATGATSQRGPQIPELSPGQLQKILSLQKAILAHPDSPQLHQRVLEASLFPEHGALVTVGVGLLKKPRDGDDIPLSLAERAAMLDAQRWAAYLLQWYQHGPELAFGTLETRLVSPSRKVQQQARNDSLLLVVAFQLPR
ncbi:MAG: hypothetical protein D6715_03245 [Calditrichaeota bacterium]|nr:MAG: hypothetical protein D6715_03245 [Calditrichota bacterium]